jgi:hypothetical protein
MIKGEIDVELVPQGTLAERLQAGGTGLGGVLTPTGPGTVVAERKQVVDVDGVPHLLEKPIKADFALINANGSDYWPERKPSRDDPIEGKRGFRQRRLGMGDLNQASPWKAYLSRASHRYDWRQRLPRTGDPADRLRAGR